MNCLAVVFWNNFWKHNEKTIIRKQHFYGLPCFGNNFNSAKHHLDHQLGIIQRGRAWDRPNRSGTWDGLNRTRTLGRPNRAEARACPNRPGAQYCPNTRIGPKLGSHYFTLRSYSKQWIYISTILLIHSYPIYIYIYVYLYPNESLKIVMHIIVFN